MKTTRLTCLSNHQFLILHSIPNVNEHGIANLCNFSCSEAPGGVLPYSLGGGVPLGSRKSYPLLE